MSVPQEVFEYFLKNHGVMLLESDYEDIKNLILRIENIERVK